MSTRDGHVCYLFVAHTSISCSVGRFPKRYGVNGPVDRQDMAYKGQGTITLEEGSAKARLGCTGVGGNIVKFSMWEEAKGLGEGMTS